MSTPLEDLEQQLRTHYQQELGEPISSSTLWSQLAEHLPAQERPAALWRRWLQAFASPNLRQPSARRLTPTSRIAVACALLLGGLLLGSGVVYTTGTFTPHQAPKVSNQPATSSNADALLLQSLLNDPRPGTQQAARQGLFSQINQTRAVKSGTVQLQKVYADANNIILGYTYAAMRTSGDLPIPFPTLSLPDGQKLKPETLWALHQEPSGLLFTVIAYFDGSSFQSHTQQVRLNISISTEGAPVHFDPLVPFSNGKTVQVHQTATVAGRTVTLNRVVITPTEARFYYISSQNVELGELSIANKNYEPGGFTYTANSPGKEHYISVSNNLQNATGSWTAKFFSNSVVHKKSVSKFLLQFTFTVA